MTNSVPFEAGRFRRILGDAGFYRTMLRIALPMALQNLIVTSVNMADVVMIGRLGEASIAAVALANQIHFLLFLLLFGVSSGSAVFTAQFWGKRDLAGLRMTLGLGLLIGVSAGLLFFAGGLFVPGHILRLYSRDPEVIRIGSEYLRIVSPCFLFTAVTLIYSVVLRSIRRVRLPLAATVVSLSLNVSLNYLLIFGKFGFPELGVRGAAYATVLARAVEMAIILAGALRKGQPLAAPIRELAGFPAAFVRRYLATTAPVILNEMGWSLGITAYNAIFARIGTSAIAAFNITDAIVRLSMVFFFGTANAAAIMIGNRIGEGGDRDEIFHYALRFCLLGIVGGMMIGAAIFGIAGIVPGAFNVSGEVRAMIRNMLMVFSLIMAVKAFNLHLVIGVLRSGGDTRFCLFLDVGFVWTIGVPLGFLGGLVWGLPIAAVYFLINSEEIIKGVVGAFRLFSRKWIRDVTRTGTVGERSVSLPEGETLDRPYPAE